jgi:hypothetical protein
VEYTQLIHRFSKHRLDIDQIYQSDLEEYHKQDVGNAGLFCFILFYSLCSIISNQLGSKLNTNNLDYCDREPKLALAESFSTSKKQKKT